MFKKKIDNNLQDNAQKRKPKHFLSKALLLKQTLFSAWKTKLQLIILLLLSAFATTIVTGTWVSYNRMVAEGKELGVNDLNFDGVLSYAANQKTGQIANQAFSLSLGRFYVSNDDQKTITKALYFDDMRLGREINPLTSNDLTIEYQKEANKITDVKNFKWTNDSEPVTFNLNANNVKASLYGQLMTKAINTNNLELRQHYLQAAHDLYRDIFVTKTAPQMLESLQKYFKEWIKANSNAPILSESDDRFTTYLLENKVNFHPEVNDNDMTIPDEVNISDSTQRSVLFTKLVKESANDPRISALNGLNGQWMRIYRAFDANETDAEVYTNFTNKEKGYSSPAQFNAISDGEERNSYSWYLARAAAALQNRSLYVRNQFTALASANINVKVVNIGLPGSLNSTNVKVFEGVLPTSSREIVISPQFARKNNTNKSYKPGDEITINNTNFIISGIGGDAYDIYPTINELDPIPNTRTQFIAYVMPQAWHNGNWFKNEDKTDTTLMYFSPWKGYRNGNFNIGLFDDFFQRTIFSDNGNSELYQGDYNKYLIAKYNHLAPPTPNNYHLQNNLVITSDTSQFAVYSGKKDLFEKSLLGFKYVAFGGVLFLVVMVIIITTLIVKKAIQHGQVSMGILKAVGYKTWQIAISYLAYPLIALVIAIPIGWVAGLVVQIYLTEIFNTLFVLPYNVFNFNIAPFFIAIALIIGFIVIVTLITAFRLLKKDPLLLIKKDSDLVLGVKNSNKSGSFLQKHFYLRFLLSLSKTSWKKIAVTSSVIALATLAIVGTTAVPATISGLKSNYFKSQKYRNYYEYQSPMPNMPISKYGLYSWNFFDRPENEPYYPVYGAMPWPEVKIIYNNKTNSRVGWYDPVAFKKGEGTTANNFGQIFKFDNSFPENQKAAFIEKMGAYYQKLDSGTLDLNDLLWAYSWLGGKGFSNQLLLDLKKNDQSANKIFSNSIIQFASTQLPSLLNVTNPGIPPGEEALKQILKQVLPGFIRQSIDNLPKHGGEDPYDYFAIGHNTIAFNPTINSKINGPEEELITRFNLAVNDEDMVKTGFMNMVGINPNTKMLVWNGNSAQALKYNPSDSIIPIVINRAFEAKYNLKVGAEFDGFPNVSTLSYKDKNGKMKPLPKSNWYYGKDPIENKNSTNSVWSKNATKWNYRNGENVTGDYSDIQGSLYNGIYNDKGQPNLSDSPETWNNLNQVWLKLPDDIDESARVGQVPGFDNKEKYNFDVKKTISSSDNKWIKPFSYGLVEELNPNNNPLNILLKRPPEWYMGMINNGILTREDTLSIDNLASDITNRMPAWWKAITGNENPVHKYRVVGIQDSYDNPKAYLDQQWANEIVGYNAYTDSTTYSGSNVYQWFNGKLSANENIFDLVGRMSFKEQLDDLSLYGTSDLEGNKTVPIIADSDLLSHKQAMLNKMSDIAFSSSVLFIITTIICAILIVIMITDLFCDQFRRFMAHMKAEGYTNFEINAFTLGIFTPWALFGFIVGFALAFLGIYSLIMILTAVSGIALPFTMAWWILPFSFAIIAAIYISTFIINNYELNKMDLIALLKSDE